MELQETQKKIKMILQQKYGVKDVEFGLEEREDYPGCPYISFALRDKKDEVNLDRIRETLTKRVLSASLDGNFTNRNSYVTVFVGKDLKRVQSSENTKAEYRRAVLVVKKEDKEKQRSVEELTEVFYDALETGIGWIRLHNYLKNKETMTEENAKTRTIAKKGYLERDTNNSYWR